MSKTPRKEIINSGINSLPCTNHKLLLSEKALEALHLTLGPGDGPVSRIWGMEVKG